MPKTDKELTAEIAVAFIQSWNGAPHTSALETKDACEVINAIYKTLRELPKED